MRFQVSADVNEALLGCIGLQDSGFRVQGFRRDHKTHKTKP